MKSSCEQGNVNIFETLKKQISFEKKLKIEKDYMYICYEISNLGNLFAGDIEVQNEIQTIFDIDKRYNNIKYEKEYLLSYGGISFTITIRQNLFRVGKYIQEYSEFNDFYVFVTNKILANVIEDKSTKTLVDKLYEFNRISYVDSTILDVFLKNDSAAYLNTIDNISILIEKLEIN